MTHKTCALLGLLLLEACITAPYDNQYVTIDAAGQVRSAVSGYADAPNAQMYLWLYNHRTGGWDQVGTVRSSLSASYTAGSLGANSPALYSYNTTATLYGSGVVNNGDHWWPSQPASLRVTKGNNPNNSYLYGGSSSSLGCFISASGVAGSDFYQNGYNCGFTLTEVDLFLSNPPIP